MNTRPLIAGVCIAAHDDGNRCLCSESAGPGSGPPPIAVGDCVAQLDFTYSFQFIGPADTFEDAVIYPSTDCTGPEVLHSTVVTASDSSAALAKCSAANSGFTLVEQLSTTGWVVSGSGDPGTPVSDQVWGCGPGA